MSSAAQGGPSIPQDDRSKERKGFGKVLSRMRTVLRKADPSKRQSARPGGSSMTPAPVAASKPTPAAPPASTPASAPAPAPAPAPSETASPSAKPTATTAVAGATRVPRTQLFEERAKKLGERYGLEIRPTEWHISPGAFALRVEKPIKMRVHRHCHACRAVGVTSSFGLARECPKCGHVRCVRCPRTPPRRTEAEREVARKRRAAMVKERAENAPIVPDWDWEWEWGSGVGRGITTAGGRRAVRGGEEAVVLRRPARTAGGQDLVRKKPRQRVRRTCCQEGCGKLFASGSKVCEGCGHLRCTDCARDPPKKDKYPYGYPGDELGTKTGHFQCHECRAVFQADPQAADAECPRCQHTRCGACERLRPRKVEPDPEPDSEVWAAVQARLEELRVR